MGVFDRLIDDAILALASAAPAEEALRQHRDLRRGPLASLLGPMVVPDHKLAEIGRTAHDRPVEVSVINTGGAGGLLALAHRTVLGVEVVAAQSPLRDLDDLAGNAARVVSAAGELDSEIAVFVEFPYVPGWTRAVEEIEAAGLHGAIRLRDQHGDRASADRLAEQLSVLVEADLPFTITDGPDRALPTGAGPGFLGVMIALEALIDGAEPRDAAELLRRDDRERLHAALAGWDDGTGARIRRRLRSVGSRAAADALDDLRLLGAVDSPS